MKGEPLSSKCSRITRQMSLWDMADPGFDGEEPVVIEQGISPEEPTTSVHRPTGSNSDDGTYGKTSDKSPALDLEIHRACTLLNQVATYPGSYASTHAIHSSAETNSSPSKATTRDGVVSNSTGQPAALGQLDALILPWMDTSDHANRREHQRFDREKNCRLPLGWVSACTDDELDGWLNSLFWQPFQLCLQHNFLQVTQCFADSRFELRRMADQVLRPLTEVALWGELSVLQQLWTSFLPLIDSLPCWVSASTFFLVLQRTSAFKAMLASYDNAGSFGSCQGLKSTADSPHQVLSNLNLIVDQVEALLPELLPSVAMLVDRASSDKVSVLAAQLIVLTHARYGKCHIHAHFQPTCPSCMSQYTRLDRLACPD